MLDNLIPKAMIVKELNDAGFDLSYSMSTEDFYSNGNSAYEIMVPREAALKPHIAERIRADIENAKKHSKK